jgi:formamidopyrimidine-DNA glycosylase
MATFISEPTIIEAAGQPLKSIEEFIGSERFPRYSPLRPQFRSQDNAQVTAKVSELVGGEMPRLLKAIQETLWGSYNKGGRWKCNVYRKAGQQCVECGGTIRSIRQPPSRRATYFCPKCQQ